MRKINEIFHSIQGEGCHTGVPSVFIRFSGCNLKCWFCDTLHDQGKMMSDDAIMAEVAKYPASQIVLTGGEPALHIDSEFINKLKTTLGLPIAIETNGTQELPEGIDWVTVSPKFGEGISGASEIKVKHADELKVIDTGQDLDIYFDLPCVTSETVMLLQPCHVSEREECQKNTRRTLGRVLEDPRWRLSLQTHRYLGIP